MSNPTLINIPVNTALDLGQWSSNQPVDSPEGLTAVRSLDYGRFTYDPYNHRILVFGGGHSGAFSSEVSAFSFTTLTWVPLHNSTTCAAMTTANFDPVGGRWISTNQPLARHVYDMMPIVEYGASRKMVILSSGGLQGESCNPIPQSFPPVIPRSWSFDLTSDTWTVGSNSGVVESWFYAASCEFDPISKKVIVVGLGPGAGGTGFWVYDPATDTVQSTTVAVPGDIYYASNMVYFPPNGKMYYIKVSQPTEVYEVTLNRTNWNLSTVIKMTGVTGSIPNLFENGFAYDSANQLIGGGIINSQFYAYNPVTKVWIARTPIMQSSLGATSIGNIAYHAIEYDPVDNVYIFMSDYNSGARTWAYKYGGSADTTAPSVPTSLVGTAISSSQINLTWAASTDNTGVTGYRIFRDGVSINTTVTLSYQDIGLAGSTSYTYTVAAYDAALNQSAPSSPVAVTTQAGGGGGGNVITSFQLTSTLTGTFPFTIGLGFKKGDVSSTPSLSITANQMIVKKRWPDNSVKHAIASGHVALTANSSAAIDVVNSLPPTGTNLTAASIQTAAPTASVQCGAIGTVTLASLLASPFRTWISGPEMVECHYRSNVGADATLVVWFHVRLYKNGRMWIRAVSENGYLNVTTVNKSYVPTVTIGGSLIYNNGGSTLTHYANTRWSSEGWIGGDPAVTPKHEMTYMMSTKLVPNYWKRNPSASAFSPLVQTYTPMNNGNHVADMGATGFAGSIGLLPNWDALYVTSGDPRAYRSMLANSSSLNSYAIVWRDSITNLIPKPNDYPTYGLGTFGTAAGPYAWELNHHPSEGYLAYLTTGDYWHYETMLFNTAVIYVILSPTGRGNGTNRIFIAQTRGTGWAMRTYAQMVGLTPDTEPFFAEYEALLANNVGYWKVKKDTLGGQGTGYLFEGYFPYGTGTTAPWQQHFFIQSFGMGKDLEPLSSMAAWNEVTSWLYRASVGILGDSTGHCFTKASAYSFIISPVSDSNPTTWYQTWAQVYSVNYGVQPCTNTLEGGSGGDPAGAAGGYWGNLLPAIAYAVDHGAAGAAASWARLTGATNWSVIENSGFDDTPLWGIVPRAAEASAPAAPTNLRKVG